MLWSAKKRQEIRYRSIRSYRPTCRGLLRLHHHAYYSSDAQRKNLLVSVVGTIAGFDFMGGAQHYDEWFCHSLAKPAGWLRHRLHRWARIPGYKTA